MCFRARAWKALRERPPLDRELAQESEQNWRRRYAVRSSSRPDAKRLRVKRAPQIKQRLPGVLVGGTGITYDLFLEARGNFRAQMSQATGKSINQRE